ncbi:MAG: TonB-dependent receptor [Sphingopyxis sp.]|uniref:TonB-dependent receptor n=1 Tax=Sphingopyxis sp. TaxID=1908224 RepID=UPI003D80EDF2
MKLRYSIAASLMAISVATVVAAPAQAQQITTGIQGQVNDDSGAAIGGATVVITDTRTGAARTITTGADGRFSTTGLTTGGPYSVSVNADSYEGQSLQDIYTTLQGSTDLTFALTSGGGEIVVTGSRVRVTQLEVGPGTSFTTEVLASAPSFNRDVRDIIRLDPRVSLDRDDGGSGQDRISCLGGNDRGNAFTVDGISQGDIYGLNDTGFSSRSSTPIPYDAVRETQVQFAPFDVDYGAFTGCAINVVTKSGTNDYQFGGFFEYSDNGLRGNNVAGQPVAPIEPEKRWGAWLGGPLIKDRLFFFGAYEHQEAGQSQDDGPAGAGYANEISGVPVAAFNEVSDVLSSVYGIETGPLVRSRPFENDRYFGRLDWQVNDDHRLELTYQRLEEASTRADDFSSSSTNPRVTGLNTFYLSGTVSDYYSARLYSQWSDEFSTELRYSRSKITDRQDPIGGGEAQSDNPIPRIIVGVESQDGTSFGQVLAGPGFSRAANDLRTQVDAFRAVGKLDKGAHQIKVGFEMNQADLFNLFVQNATGTLYFENIDDLRAGLLSGGSFTNPTAQQIADGDAVGAEGNFTATGVVTDAAAAFKRTAFSIFAQDDWEVSDRLNAVIGVRADWYSGGQPNLNPVFLQRYGFSNTTAFSNLPPIVMPRVALTYDMDDFAMFGRPKLTAGVGIFSGGDPLVWFGNAFQNDGRGFATGTTNDAQCAPIKDANGQIDVVTGGQFTGVPACFQQSASNNAARGLGDTQSISPNIKMPSVLRANIGFSSELNFAPSGFFSGWNLNLDYIYSKYRNPFTLVDLSQTVNPALGIDGYTVDGRPIYRSIDPNAAGCDAVLVGLNPGPVYENVNAGCFSPATGRDDELQLTNSAGFRSHNASFILSKTFDGGLFTENGNVDFNVGYAYTDAQDRRSMYNSTAGSNYDLVAASDRQNPAASRSFYSSTHNISSRLAFREEFFEDLSTRFAVSFIARSGRPYSLTFTGGGVFNDSASGFENALLYIPTGINDPNIRQPIFNGAGVQTGGSNLAAVQQLVDFASNLGCAKKYLGRTIDRNTCSNDWYFDVDLSFSQELPGPGRLFGRNDKIKLYATMDNFLNFLDQDWNVQRRRNFAGLQDLATGGVDTATGQYIISGFNDQAFAEDNQINVSSSVWRLKVGVSYEF